MENINAHQEKVMEGSKPQHDAEQRIVRNAETVKRLDKEIETIVKDKSKKKDKFQGTFDLSCLTPTARCV